MTKFSTTQGPYGGMPVVRRALIVTPSSLTNNWGKEFKKWLGKERIQPYIVDQNHKVGFFFFFTSFHIFLFLFLFSIFFSYCSSSSIFSFYFPSFLTKWSFWCPVYAYHPLLQKQSEHDLCVYRQRISSNNNTQLWWLYHTKCLWDVLK